MEDAQSLAYYIDLLKSGKLAAFPTETVYGLGADAKNPSAVSKIFKLKGRPTDNPLIVHVSSLSMVKEFARDIPQSARKLMDTFWPGPLTLIFKKRESVLDMITAGLETVAIRMPDNETALALIRETGPLVAPSANKSGRPSPTTPAHIRADFGQDFPILGTLPTRIGIESTVLDVSSDPYQILRPGAITKKQIDNLVGRSVLSGDPKQSPNNKSRSPGTKYTHYSPRADVSWLPANAGQLESETLYILHSGNHPLRDKQTNNKDNRRILVYNRDYDRMARELYDRFRQADIKGLQYIAIEPFSEELLESDEITIALHNRISKAIGR